jgi:hypothetical protein
MLTRLDFGVVFFELHGVRNKTLFVKPMRCKKEKRKQTQNNHMTQDLRLRNCNDYHYVF